jgi:hypothetical protein
MLNLNEETLQFKRTGSKKRKKANIKRNKAFSKQKRNEKRKVSKNYG